MSDPANTSAKLFSGPRYFNVYSQEKGAGVLEQALVVLWFTVTYLPLGQFAPIRYLCILALLGILALDRDRLAPIFLRAWPLFTVPILGILSIGWSPYTGAAIREGILLLLTAITCVVIAGRLTPLQMLRTIWIAGIFATIYSAPHMDRFHIGGLYGSKNQFGAQMLFCLLLSVITFLNEKEAPLLRLIALPFIPICFIFQYMADSATSLIFAILGIIALVGVKVFWSPVSRVRSLAVLVLMGCMGIALILALMVWNMPQNQYVAQFLLLVGKDTTLTGRTEIWHVAEFVSSQNPMFGVGLEGFWQPSTGLAQTLNELQFRDAGTKLTFHSAYWEVRVHLGLVGLGLFVFYLAWSSLRLFGLWFADGSLVHSALVVIVLVNVTMAFTESYLWSTFTTAAYLQGLAGIAPMRLFDPKYVGRARAVTAPA